MTEGAQPSSTATEGTTKGHQAEKSTWRPLRFFNLYRFTLAALFILLYHMGPLPPPLGSFSPKLFYAGSLALLFFSLLSMFSIGQRWPSFFLQLHQQVIIDVILITLLMHASGGVGSGVEMLLLVSVANGSMIAGGRSAGLFAAIAAITVLMEQSYTLLALTDSKFSFPQAGFLGAALFVTAFLIHILARRARESEELASQRELDLADMAQMTEYVIQQMDTGILVVDLNDRVRLMNQTARKVLSSKAGSNPELAKLSRGLLEQLHNWKEHSFFRPQVLEMDGGTEEFLPRFMPIGQKAGTLIFLEDVSLANRQAQQLKLASLGRLTASIAHEVRNPLGAISHAVELLGESPNLDKQDNRLTEIILEQSRRIDIIIDSVTQLGKRDSTHPVTFQILPWLTRFISDLCEQQSIQQDTVEMSITPEDLVINFDTDHLHQILWNLCQNGLRHASSSTQPCKLRLCGGLNNDGRVYLDVIDSGKGIAEEEHSKIFEPFYTTESRGTGLGLYICRELASANRAQLSYQPTADGLSRFRLLFATVQGVAQ